MAELPHRFYVHRIVVQPYEGSGAYGDVFGQPVEVPAWVRKRRRYVRSGEGVEILSDARILLDLEFLPYTMPGSLVTLHTELDGVPLEERRVISQDPRTDGGMGAWQHLAVEVG